MKEIVSLGNRLVGNGNPCMIIAEIGINHNGDPAIAKKLVDTAILAGCDAVKFQKRTPELCVPEEQRSVMRETPWGIMSYFEYRKKIELSNEDFKEVVRYCRQRGILWFASCWDIPSVEFIESLDPFCYKIASASLTDKPLFKRLVSIGKPLFLSTGMSTVDQIDSAVDFLSNTDLLIAHSTSTYPCKPAELNLNVLKTLKAKYPCPVGYSGHETGLQTTYAALVLGASFIERHITLDRAMWGGDQAASLEPGGLIRLVRDIRVIESALGDGRKKVYDSELPVMKKLRIH